MCDPANVHTTWQGMFFLQIAIETAGGMPFAWVQTALLSNNPTGSLRIKKTPADAGV
jgi:hypothetical protein